MTGLRLLADLGLGGLFGGGRVQSMLDTAPLPAFLGARCRSKASATRSAAATSTRSP
jgi:hypothetical protein